MSSSTATAEARATNPPRPVLEVVLEAVENFDRLACTDCGTSFPAPDGPALLYGLKAPCHECGGELRLIPRQA